MSDRMPFRGSTGDVDALRARMERLGFRTTSVMGPDEAAFGDMVLDFRSDAMDARITRDRGQVWVEVLPRDDDRLRFAPSEWLAAAGVPWDVSPLSAGREVDALEAHLPTVARLVADPTVVGGRDGLLAARRTLWAELERQGRVDS